MPETQVSDASPKVSAAAIATVAAAVIAFVGAVFTANFQWIKQREASLIEAENQFILKGIGPDQLSNVQWLEFLIKAGLVRETEKLKYMINNPDEFATILTGREPTPPLPASATIRQLVLALSSSNTEERLTAFSGLQQIADESQDKAETIVSELAVTNIDGYRTGISSPNGLYNSIVFLNSLPSQTIQPSTIKGIISKAISDLFAAANNSDRVHVGERTREQIDQLKQRL